MRAIYRNKQCTNLISSLCYPPRKISEMLSVTPAAAGCLMRSVKYNKERLLDGFMSDPDAFLFKAGVYKRVRCDSMR